MNDAAVTQDQWDYFAQVQRDAQEAERQRELSEAYAPFIAKDPKYKIQGLPTKPYDERTSSLNYRQGAYEYNGYWGTPVWANGRIIGYEFVKYDVAPGLQSVVRTDLDGNVSQDVVMPMGEGQDIMGAILAFAPVLLMAIPGAGQILGAQILGAGASQATAAALGNAIINGAISEAQGGSFVKGAALSYATSAIPNLEVMREGAAYLNGIDPTGTMASSFTQASTAAVKAAITGDSISDAVLSGLISGGTTSAANAILKDIDGYKDLRPAQQEIIRSRVSNVLQGNSLSKIGRAHV
jgi:hypothetical protein